MRRRIALSFLALCGALAALLVTPVTASAHPLGNFTTNQHTEVVASGDHLYVVSVLDLAEVPTFQARAAADRLGRAEYARSLGESLRRGLAVRVDGSPRSLVELDRRLTFPLGVASLRTTRLEVVFDAGDLRAGRRVAVQLENDAFASRIGWREIVVRGERGAQLASELPTASVSDRLRTYPKDLLQSPLDNTSASFALEASAIAGVPPRIGTFSETAPTRDAETGSGGFASLVERDELSLGFVLVALVLALFWGAAHALTPGHGKAIVAAYLMGTKGRPRDAFALGGIVTVTHTIGVFALGIAALALSEFIVPEDLYPWMNLISALLVVAVGVTVLRQRVLTARANGHDHAHEHWHHLHHEGMTEEEHARAHLPAQGSGAKGLLAVGISGGLLPCPTALVVLLAAISLHRIGYGLALILAFSVGLAAVVSGIALLAVTAKRAFSRMSFEGRLVRVLPAVSALVILFVGLAMTLRAVPNVL